MITNTRVRILCIFSMLAVVFLLNACGRVSEEDVQLPSTQESVNNVQPPSKQEILDSVIAAADDIKTSQFDMNMTMDMSGEAAGATTEATMVMHFSGVLDQINRKMKEDVTITIITSATDKEEMAMTMYLLNGTAYFLAKVPGMTPQWLKAETPAANWEATNPVESQLELLEGAQIEVTGSEIVHGVDCYVLQLTPDIEQLWQIAMQQAQVTGEKIPDTGEEFLEEMFQSFSVKQWIAKDTCFLTKVHIDMNVELTPEQLGSPGEEGIVQTAISMDIFFHNYNQPVSIVLPPEAEEAVEVPMNM